MTLNTGSLRLLFGAVLLILLAGLGTCHAKATGIGGDFSLTDQDNRPFQLEQLRGKVVVLFFGYTFCPDICPTELSNLSRVLDGLEADAQRVQGLFVTIDPERDKPEVIKSYVGYFNENLIGLTGTQAEIRRVASLYRAQYRKQPRPGGAYSMDHSASLYVIDRSGQLSAVVPYGLPPEHVLRVVKHFLANDS
jgi:protein SCO1/2